MFAQVIEGRTSNAEGFRAALDRWMTELAPGSIGWLGSTTGVTDDGRVIAVARFESADAARRNAERPEQSRWWEQTRELFDGEVSFRDSEDVTVEVHGDPGRARFVQVMQGQVSDPERARELMGQMSLESMAAFRPEILGSVMVNHDEGRWTQAIYFTSEAEAREGEAKQPPLEVQAALEQLMKLGVGEPEFLDLREPLLFAPATG